MSSLRQAHQRGPHSVQRAPDSIGDAIERKPFYRIAMRAMRWPVLVVIGLTAALLLAAAPFLRMEPSIPDYRVLPQGNEVRDATDAFNRQLLPNQLTPHDVLLRFDGDGDGDGTGGAGDTAFTRENLTKAHAVSLQLAQLPHVEKVLSVFNAVPWLPRRRRHQRPRERQAQSNSTGADLRLPGTNPLRSLGEIAGKISPDYRPTVMDLLRGSVKRELEQRKIVVSFPEERDARLQSFPFEAGSAATNARAANLSGWLLLSDIRRWNTDGRAPLSTLVEMRLVRIDNGAIIWNKQFQKVVPMVGAARLDEASADAVKEILREMFAG